MPAVTSTHVEMKMLMYLLKKQIDTRILLEKNNAYGLRRASRRQTIADPEDWKHLSVKEERRQNQNMSYYVASK
jgi:hypothetical protein